MALGRTIPALPVSDIGRAVQYYTEQLGFVLPHRDDGFAIVRRDDAELHLWLAGDAGWSERADLIKRPVRSGAESFLAGTASCRVQVSADGLDQLFAEYAEQGRLHQVSQAGIVATDYGTREFSMLDADGNLLTFFCPFDP
jgi:catechol 2,3-dioxygenase-like lactoylglutathione lyase family enzyme